MVFHILKKNIIEQKLQSISENAKGNWQNWEIVLFSVHSYSDDLLICELFLVNLT